MSVWSLPMVASPTSVHDTITLATAEALGIRRWPTTTAVAPLQVLQGETLLRLGGLSVADALRHFSGLQIKDYGGVGGLKTINVRSLGTHHTAVALDGVALHNAQNGQIDLGRFALDALDAVAVGQHADATQMASASSLLSAAMVQLHSRRPQFATGQGHTWGAAVGVGSFDTYTAQVRYAQRLTPRQALALNVAGLSTSGRYGYRYRTATPQGHTANDTSGTRHNGDVCYLRAEANYYLSPTATQPADVAVKAYIYTSARGLPGAVVRGLPTHADRQWDTNTLLQATLRHRLGTWHLHATTRWAYDYLHYRTDPEREAGVMHIDHRYHQSEAYLSALLRRQWQGVGEHTLTLATDARWNGLQSNRADFVPPRRQHYVGAVAYRYKWHTLTADGHATWGHVSDHVATESTKRKARSTMALALAYAPTSSWTLRAMGKQSYRLPTLNDMYYTEVGNSDLRVERTTQWTLGADYRLRTPHLTAEVNTDLYLNHVWDKIVAVPTSNQFRWTMMNLGRVRILGNEWRIALSTPHTLWGWTPHLRLSYTYQHATDRTNATAIYYGHQIAYIPRHAGTLALQLHQRAWWVSATCIYTGARHDQQTNVAENFVPAWYTTDIAIGYTPQRWRITAEVNNLFNQRYDIVKGYPLPGTNARMTVQYSF